MATLNPLEAKARSSFWKGIIIAALFGILGCSALGYFLYTKVSKENARIKAQKKIFVFSQNVISGQIITEDMLKQLDVDANMAPADAGSFVAATEDQMVDVDGHAILLAEDEKEAEQNIYYLVEDEDSNRQVKIQYDEKEDVYKYIEGDKKGKVVELGESIYVAKIDIPANTVLVPGMVKLANEQLTPDVREREYNCIVLPTDVATDETVDVRLKLPTGEDYIVLSKKRVIATSEGDMSTNYCKFKLNDIETLMLNAAIVDAAMLEGSSIYAVKYVDAGMQKEARTTYEPSTSILSLIQNDPNAIQTAKDTLIAGFANGEGNGLRANYRQIINQKLGQLDIDEQKDKAASAAQEQTSTQVSDRAAFLGGMGE